MSDRRSRPKARSRFEIEDPDTVISRYCGDIEARIRKAGSASAAAEIVEQACSSLERECASEMAF